LFKNNTQAYWHSREQHNIYLYNRFIWLIEKNRSVKDRHYQIHKFTWISTAILSRKCFNGNILSCLQQLLKWKYFRIVNVIKIFPLREKRALSALQHHISGIRSQDAPESANTVKVYVAIKIIVPTNNHVLLILLLLLLIHKHCR